MIWPFNKQEPAQDLLQKLEDPDAETRKKAFNALIEHENPETNSLILGTMQVLHEAPRELLLSLIDLCGQRGIEEATGQIRRFLSDEDPIVKTAALRALVHIPTQASLDAILPLLADEDLTIRREVREAVAKIFRERAMGALIRAIPDDHNTPLYFEIVSLFEEMGFFDAIKESFQHPDTEVKKFQLSTMVKFHHPDFIPLYLELIESNEMSVYERIKTALLDYSPDELLPPLRESLIKSASKLLLALIEDIVLTRFPEGKEDFLRIAKSISKAEIRLELLERILKKVDALLFFPILSHIDDTSPQIRTLACDTLIRLFQGTKGRFANPQEQNKAFLKKEMDQWIEEVIRRLQKEESGDLLQPLIKLAFAMTADSPAFLAPALPKLLSKHLPNTIKHLATWESEAVEKVLIEACKIDRDIGSLLIHGLTPNSSPEFVRIILKNLIALQGNELTLVRKVFINRGLVGRLPPYLDDPDPKIRAAVLDLSAESGNDRFARKVEEKCRDPAPEVRRKALQVARMIRHPKAVELLEEACGDPDHSVSLQALREMKGLVPPDRFAKLLTKAVGHPNEEIRGFALHEVAKITQQRYIENYNTLPAQVKKLAGSALAKLDTGFVDTLIAELRSLDPDSRLRSAMIMENIQVGRNGKEALLAGMKDPSRKVRAAIVKTLGVLGDKALTSNLIEFFNDPDERVRANAIEAVAGIGDEQAAKMLLPFLDDPNNRIRANAALACWQVAKINILPVLKNMLTSQDPLMKASALWVIGEIKDEGQMNIVLNYLRDRNELVRINAVKCLAKVKPELLKPFLPALRKESSAEIKRIVTDLSYKLI